MTDSTVSLTVSRITLENFRGARSLSLDLHPRLNVFVGVNGAGKTTVLDAVAILLSWLVARLRTEQGTGRPVSERDITNGCGTATIGIAVATIPPDPEVLITREAWRLSKARAGHRREEVRSVLAGARSLAHKLQSSGDGEPSLLPLLVYYPVNRAVLDIPLRIRARHTFDRLAAYDDSLTSGADFRRFFEWFREREDLENERLRDQLQLSTAGGDRQPDIQLEAVRRALARLMPAFSGLAVRRSPLRMEVLKEGKPLAVDQLSDGEKCLMAMVGDLARRLAILNPMLPDPLHGPGVVLIDELDLHLHPKLQHAILLGLQEVFPNCQFLLSTHSPHVITHVARESLFLLEATEEGLLARCADTSYGRAAERVLEDLMGMESTRPDKVAYALRAIFDQIGQGHLNAAREAVTALRHDIGNDPDLLRADLLIQRRELLQ